MITDTHLIRPLLHPLRAPLALPDYTTSLLTFQTRLTQDATSFRPFGHKIGSYTRPSGAKEAASKGKGKGKESKKRILEGEEEEEEGDVVFEMWKVSFEENSDAGFERMRGTRADNVGAGGWTF